MYLTVVAKNFGSGRNETHYGDGEYDYEWSEDNDYTIEGLRFFKNGGDFPVKEKPKLGDKFILVYVKYTHGDSFGYSCGNFAEVELFENTKEGLEDAKKLIKLIKENYDHYESENSYNREDYFIEFNGKKIYTYTWKGHFESLEDVDYKLVEVIKV